jgi:hypothetical protein
MCQKPLFLRTSSPIDERFGGKLYFFECQATERVQVRRSENLARPTG